MPLLAHLLIFIAGKPEQSWNANWAPDLLFNQHQQFGHGGCRGLHPDDRGDQPVGKFPPLTRIVWVTLLVCFALSSMRYGVDVTGADNGRYWMAAAILVVLSGICSLNFEIAMAKLKTVDPSSTIA